MDIKHNEQSIYYQEKLGFIKNVCAWMLFFMTITMLFINQINLYSMILVVIRLLIVLTLLMFINHSDNINPKPIQKIIKINIIIVVVISALEIIPVEDFNLVNNIFIIEGNNSYVDNVHIFFAITYYIVSKYNNENDNSIIREYIVWIFIIILTKILGNFYFENSMFIIVVNKILTEVLLILSIINMNKIEKINPTRVNVIRVVSIVSLICMNIVEVFNFIGLGLIGMIILTFNFAIVIAGLTAVIDNISLNMYSFIFKDINNINKTLEEVNYEIMVRSRELERVELEVESKRKKYKELLNSLPKSIIMVNIENNRIIYCNPDFQNLIGIKNIREILNKKLENILTLNFDYKNLKNLNRSELYFGSVMSNNEKQVEIRLGNYNKNKQEITMIFEDITEKIKIEKIKGEIEKKKINDNIKKNFLSNVSHDFKIPINVIYSATQLQNLLISNNDIEGVRKYNSISKQNCLTLIKLTNNIIDISKITSEHMNIRLRCGNIVEFIEDKVVSLVEYAILSKINIIFDTEEEELYMKYDRELMERIILNLVSNSVKFTPEGGIINIKIAHNEDSIFISVEDNGIGMDKEFAKEVFNKYSKGLTGVYGNVQGTGIGLYVVYNLVNLQKGEIWVNSEIGKGAKFTMKFCKENFYGST